MNLNMKLKQTIWEITLCVIHILRKKNISSNIIKSWTPASSLVPFVMMKPSNQRPSSASGSVRPTGCESTLRRRFRTRPVRLRCFLSIVNTWFGCCVQRSLDGPCGWICFFFLFQKTTTSSIMRVTPFFVGSVAFRQPGIITWRGFRNHHLKVR